ncbi:MAG: DUF447 family protein [Anaerolineales bacterium]|nr:DUF447 family protein [Anaerolineales bacterium]
MIIEVIFSTLDENGRPNFAPMGVTWGQEELIVHPFRNTDTYRNLTTTGCGVANVTDNVLLFAQSALSDPIFPHFDACHVRSIVLEDVCYWREAIVTEVGGGDMRACPDGSTSSPRRPGRRAEIRCRVVGQGWRRDFLGFDRAKNAVIEAAIVATRLHLHDQAEVQTAFRRYQEIVDKLGGDQEREAMQYLCDYVGRWTVARAR